jgi:ATP-dependent DNA ligase
MSTRKAKATFIEPMLLVRTNQLPEGANWLYELKLDGYRALAIKTGASVQLRSRNDNDFTLRYPAVSMALAALPDETVIDGEVVALDEEGRPSFNILQNYGSSQAPVVYYVFDVLIVAGRIVMDEPLHRRRELLEQKVLPRLSEPVRYSPTLDASLADLVRSVCAQGLEGCKAARQRLRTGPALWRLAEDADQPRAGVRYRRVYGRLNNL